MKAILLVPVLGLIGIAAAQAASSPVAAPAGLNRQTTVLGKAFGFTLASGANAAQTGLIAAVNANILGTQQSLIWTSVQPTTDYSKGQIQVYLNGLQVNGGPAVPFAGGDWTEALSIPPVNKNVTIFSYPIGPIVIQVDGGYAFNGKLNTDLKVTFAQPTAPAATTPETPAPATLTTAPTPPAPSAPPTAPTSSAGPSSIDASIDSALSASGFIEGSVSLFIIRGGLQGQVDLADGTVQSKADLYFGKTPPSFTSSG